MSWNVNRWMSNQESCQKYSFQKISVTNVLKLVLKISLTKDQRKKYFCFHMNHLSSYVLRMMRDLHSKLDLSKQGNNKKWRWYDFAGFSQNEIIFEGGNERNSSSCSSKMEWCMVKGEETWFNQRSFVLFAHLLGLNGCSLDVVPNSLQYYYSCVTTLFPTI